MLLSSYHSSDKALLFLWRIEHEYDACVPELRKALTFREASRIHQSCGAFLHFIKQLRDLAPESDFESVYDGLKTQVPPGDLAAIGSFRRPLGPLMHDFLKLENVVKLFSFCKI